MTKKKIHHIPSYEELTKGGVELKPCPFCGSKPFICKLVAGVHLGCNNEDCTASRLYTGQYLTEAEAIAAWNTRSPL